MPWGRAGDEEDSGVRLEVRGQAGGAGGVYEAGFLERKDRSVQGRGCDGRDRSPK